MKIRLKLLLLTLGMFVLFGIAATAYFVILSPVETIQKESSVVARTVLAATQLQARANRLTVDNYTVGTEGLAEGQKDWESAVASIDEVHLLPTLGPEVAEAFHIIKNLVQLTAPSLQTLDDSFGVIKADAARVASTGNNGYLLKFFADYIPNTKDHKLDPQSKADIADFARAISILSFKLDAVVSTLSEEGAVVDRAVTDVRLRSSMIALGIVVTILVLGLLVSLMLARSIAKSLAELGGKVEVMGTGDLRVSFATRRRDETGILGAHLNQLLFSFQIALGEIQKSAAQNAQVKDRLVQGVASATSSAVEIEANSKAIASRMEQLDGMIEQSTVRMRKMSQGVGIFNEKIGRQNEHVGNSVSAVTQMMASIGNITRITEKDRDEAERLVEEAEAGSEAFDETFSKALFPHLVDRLSRNRVTQDLGRR